MSTTNDPRICIVGAGSLSTKRIHPYIGAAGGQLVGVCDLNLEAAERNARRFGGAPYSDMETMLDVEKPDGVIICIGPEAHSKLAPIVMKRGIPVYTEKPPAPTAKEALAVAKVSAETGVLCMTAFKKRYATPYERARNWIDALPVGDLLGLSLTRACGHRANDSSGTALLLDFGIHDIDLLAYLGGEIESVFSFSRDSRAFAISIRFANGAVGTMHLSDGGSFAIPIDEFIMTARGGNTMSVTNSSSWRIATAGEATEWREPPTTTSSGDSGNDTGHLAEIVAFVNAVKSGESTRSNIYEGYKSLAVFEAMWRSTASGKAEDVLYEKVEA